MAYLHNRGRGDMIETRKSSHSASPCAAHRVRRARITYENQTKATVEEMSSPIYYLIPIIDNEFTASATPRPVNHDEVSNLIIGKRNSRQPDLRKTTTRYQLII